jgi:hypothetical protein
VHGHVSVAGYLENNCEYCARVGAFILITFVTLFGMLIHKIYTGTANDTMNKKMDNPVDICLTRRLRWSIAGDAAEKK